MKTLKKNINKWDLILVTAFLSIAAISFIGYRIIHQAPAVTVEISSFGQVVETVDISRDGTYEIPNALGASIPSPSKTPRSPVLRRPVRIKSVSIRATSPTTVR